MDLIKTLMEVDLASYESLRDEAFAVGQLSHATNTAGAVSKMAARFSVGDDALVALVRQRSDVFEQRQRLDARLVQAISRPASERARKENAVLRTEIAALDRGLEELYRGLARDFPEYAELTSPQPLELVQAMQLLKSDEAMVVYLLGPDESFLWVVRTDRTAIFRLGISQAAVAEAVATLRRALDLSTISGLGDIRKFDQSLAHSLYRQIFAPASPVLDGVRHVIVVPHGALQSLPFGVLVSVEPQRKGGRLLAYRDVPWLARRYAFSTLPSVGSLRAFRKFARARPAAKPFIGFGDPRLLGQPGGARGVNAEKLFVRASVADVEAVRALPPLPETAGELAAIARSLGAGADSLHLRDEAMERSVRELPLSDYRVVAFATHGLVAGDFDALAEPALVLTPPKLATADDDGLLTASEVAKLHLNADWVVLSACNTAAPDGSPGAEGLSGLAKAFFYAGSRTVLVSLWAVASDAAVRLTTGIFEALASIPELGRAEAHQISMLALIDDTESPHYAHPIFWAPFVVVGEGGTDRRLIDP